MGLTLSPDARVQEPLAGSKLRPVFLEGMQTVLVTVPAKHREELDRVLRQLKELGFTVAGDIAGQKIRGATDSLRPVATEIDRARGNPGPTAEKDSVLNDSPEDRP
jgi:hypothetical protein